MSERTLTISYPDELLLSLKESASEFESEARRLLAIKLFELGRVSTGMAARIAGMGRVAFFFTLKDHGLSPIGVEASELKDDLRSA